jgi:hypothetical protein
MRSFVSFTDYRKGGQIMSNEVGRNMKTGSVRDGIYNDVVSNELV